MNPTLVDVIPLLGHFGPSADGSAHTARSLDCSSAPNLSIQALCEQFPFVERLAVTGRELCERDLTTILSLPHLVELSAVNCGLGKLDIDWKTLPVCPLLITLNLSSNDLDQTPVFDFCPNLINLDLSRNQLSSLSDAVAGVSLPYLERLDISHNIISSLAGKGHFPNLFWLSVAHNILVTDLYLDRFPALRHCDISHNRIPTIEHLSPIYNPNLTVLLLNANCINQLSCLKRLIPFKLLRELVVTTDETLSPSQKDFTSSKRFKRPDNDGLHVAVPLRDARILALGDLMARQDEVSFAVGINRMADIYTDAPSANQQLFEKCKKAAVATLPTPANTLRALLIYIFPQLFYLNRAEITVEERLEAEAWILPSDKTLALTHVIGL